MWAVSITAHLVKFLINSGPARLKGHGRWTDNKQAEESSLTESKGYKASVWEGDIAQSFPGAAFLPLILQQESPIHSPEETAYAQPTQGLHGPVISMPAKICT